MTTPSTAVGGMWKSRPIVGRATLTIVMSMMFMNMADTNTVATAIFWLMGATATYLFPALLSGSVDGRHADLDRQEPPSSSPPRLDPSAVAAGPVPARGPTLGEPGGCLLHPARAPKGAGRAGRRVTPGTLPLGGDHLGS